MDQTAINQHVAELTRMIDALQTALKGYEEIKCRTAAATDIINELEQRSSYKVYVPAGELINKKVATDSGDAIENVARVIAEASPHAIALLMEIQTAREAKQ